MLWLTWNIGLVLWDNTRVRSKVATYDVYYLLVIQSLAVLIGLKKYKFITVVIKHD